MFKGESFGIPFFHYKLNKMIVSEMYDWYLARIREGLTGEEIEQQFDDMINVDEHESPFEDIYEPELPFDD